MTAAATQESAILRLLADLSSNCAEASAGTGTARFWQAKMKHPAIISVKYTGSSLDVRNDSISGMNISSMRKHGRGLIAEK